MKRPHAAPHENHERWLVSYADFITLLFAFFVVMFASAQSDKSKAQEVSAAVREALEHGQFTNTLATVLGKGRHESSTPPIKPGDVDNVQVEPPPPPPEHPKDLAQSLESLEAGLAADIASGKISVELERRGLVIGLREAAFFGSGDDVVARVSVPLIEKIAKEIGTLPNPVRVEGYTDSIPIHNSRFRSNWELSAARAIAMMELLRSFSIDSNRLSVVGYAENAPCATNETPEGRAHNRRVDLVVLSAEAELTEPKPGPGSEAGSKAKKTPAASKPAHLNSSPPK